MDIVKIKLLNFEGPLDLLPALIRSGEIEPTKISLIDIINQLIEQWKLGEELLEVGAQSMGHIAHLLYLKSRALLPSASIPAEEAEDEEGKGIHLALLEKLVEYCRFKDAARTLSLKEERARVCFARQTTEIGTTKRPLGIEHISLIDFSNLFKEVLKKASDQRGTIHEEEWRVADKITWFRKEIKACEKIEFIVLFSSSKSKIELIVLFLAVLELMKLGELVIFKEGPNIYLKGEKGHGIRD